LHEQLNTHLLPRVLEPELMDSVDEAEEYDRIDHQMVNERFVADFLSAARTSVTTSRVVIDVGAGTARVPIALCGAWAGSRVMAVDMATSMLRTGVKNVRRATLDSRILCTLADARRLPLPDGAAPFVISNSLIHHIADVETVLREMTRVTAPGGVLFVRDLFRPATAGDVEQLVSRYAAYETPLQRALFDASLRAALTCDEVREVVGRLPLRHATVVASSDRHWTLTAIR
jgi:ubiquinone/menaquinone biosynthesis C-methylase UbiE